MTSEEQRARWRAYQAEHRARQKAAGIKREPGKTSGGQKTAAERARRYRERKKSKDTCDQSQ